MKRQIEVISSLLLLLFQSKDVLAETPSKVEVAEIKQSLIEILPVELRSHNTDTKSKIRGLDEIEHFPMNYGKIENFENPRSIKYENQSEEGDGNVNLGKLKSKPVEFDVTFKQRSFKEAIKKVFDGLHTNRPNVIHGRIEDSGLSKRGLLEKKMLSLWKSKEQNRYDITKEKTDGKNSVLGMITGGLKDETPILSMLRGKTENNRATMYNKSAHLKPDSVGHLNEEKHTEYLSEIIKMKNDSAIGVLKDHKPSLQIEEGELNTSAVSGSDIDGNPLDSSNTDYVEKVINNDHFFKNEASQDVKERGNVSGISQGFSDVVQLRE